MVNFIRGLKRVMEYSVNDIMSLMFHSNAPELCPLNGNVSRRSGVGGILTVSAIGFWSRKVKGNPLGIPVHQKDISVRFSMASY